MNKKKSLIFLILEYILIIITGVIIFNFIRNDFDLLISVLIINIVMTTLVFFVSIIHNNSSVYDPYWSVIPIVIVIIWIYSLGLTSIASFTILLGIFVWGFRLTNNWYLNFEGLVKEDFRYMDFRKTFKKAYWIISYLGIHMFPTLIVYLSLYPIYFVFTNVINYEAFIYIGVVIMIFSAIISYYSDNELRTHKKNNNKESIKTGIWAYSRHPNYLGELMFWVGCYVVSLSVGLDLMSVLGIVAMIILFNFYSIPKMEKKLLRNKSDYQMVIDSVPRLLPLVFLKRDQELESN